jgi:hypothetical protein
VSRYAARLVAAVVLTAATGLGLPAPARAASCSTGHGVTVVVDFHQLGGGVRSACDPGGAGRNASTQVTDVGHTLTYAQRQPGFVCRVDGSPSSRPVHQHLARRRLLVPVVVGREVGHLVVLV